MTTEQVSALWFRPIQGGDFHHIERKSQPGDKGGKATYIEIPGSLVDGTLQLIDSSWDDLSTTINAGVMGNPAVAGPLEFARKRPDASDDYRMRITNQNKHQEPLLRHPAWQASRGFPEAPSTVSSADEARAHFPGGRLCIYVVRTEGGKYYASFTTGTDYPAEWPDHPWLQAMFDAKEDVGRFFDANRTHQSSVGVDRVIGQIIQAWARGKGALLYGPPGTGKTLVMSELRRRIEKQDWGPTLEIDPSDGDNPFSVVGLEPPFPTPVTSDWLTFHQDYSYDDFVIGLRPVTPESGVGLLLQPRMGRLLELVYDVWSEDEDPESAVLFIDEINRGNAARIFGEFITFMDREYRDLPGSRLRIPIPLPGLGADAEDRTEAVERVDGSLVHLPRPWFFPEHIYTVASMNSVDRAAIPLDSALARRFVRIELRPDLRVLASHFGLVWPDVMNEAIEARNDESEAWKDLSAPVTALLLLDRLNARIDEHMGPDFELGHGLVWRVGIGESDDHQWTRLVEAWDGELLPQVFERYLNRPADLLDLLKVDERPAEVSYAFRRRTLLGVTTGQRDVEALSDARLGNRDLEVQRSTLRWLAR